MNPIKRMERELHAALPDAHLTLDAPDDPAGDWFLDVRRGEQLVVVQWRPDRGFGVTSDTPDAGYGAGPDEVHDTVEAARDRVAFLLLKGEVSSPPAEVALRDLRAHAGVTQVELAHRLGVQQAAVSRTERRPGVSLSKLSEFVRALDAELEVSVRTKDGRRVKLVGLDKPEKVA